MKRIIPEHGSASVTHLVPGINLRSQALSAEVVVGEPEGPSGPAFVRQRVSPVEESESLRPSFHNMICAQRSAEIDIGNNETRDGLRRGHLSLTSIATSAVSVFKKGSVKIPLWARLKEMHCQEPSPARTLIGVVGGELKHVALSNRATASKN